MREQSLLWPRVGIDRIGLYLPGYALALDELARAREVPVDKILLGLGAHKMAVAPPWEDTVTLGANAAARVLASGCVAREEIGLLLVATETAVDHAKPVSIFLHELLELPSNCRTFELKHACYSGTAGVMIASDWIRSGAARGRRALVVATDIARYDLRSSAEFTQGAGAVALVVSESPRLLELDPVTGVYASNVYDFWRPLDRREALVDGKYSLDCYLAALDGALDDYRAGLNGAGSVPLTSRCAALLYHTPFPKMAYKAHLRLLEREWNEAARRGDEYASRFSTGSPEFAQAAEQSYAALVEPALGLARLTGNTYTASLYICLAWLAERRARELEGRELGLFSYGSGCCAEFFSGHFVEGSAAATAEIGAAELLERRRELSVAEYESFMREGAQGGAPGRDDTGFCHLAAVRDHKRFYERSAWPR
jgi:hydroxymethylglutaryl-CoA synthase